MNQVLFHISNSPLELIDYCQNKGIVMEAYSPVAHGEALKNEKINLYKCNLFLLTESQCFLNNCGGAFS